MRARIKALIHFFFHPSAATRPIQSWIFLFCETALCVRAHISEIFRRHHQPTDPSKNTNFLAQKNQRKIEKFYASQSSFRPPPMPPTHAHMHDGVRGKKCFIKWKILRKNALAFFLAPPRIFLVFAFFTLWGGKKNHHQKRARVRKREQRDLLGYFLM